MSNRDRVGRSSDEIEGVSDTAEIANLIVTRARNGDLLRERESGDKDEAEYFFADRVGKIESTVGIERE